MGFFSTKSSEQSPGTGKTIIAQGCRVNGELTDLEGALHIDGLVEGIIETDFDVSIGRTGKVSGLVKARSIVVSGLLEGRIACDSLEIVAQGKVLGQIVCSQLTVEPDGKFIGERHEMSEDGLLIGFTEITAQLTKDKVKHQILTKIEESLQDTYFEKAELNDKNV